MAVFVSPVAIQIALLRKSRTTLIAPIWMNLSVGAHVGGSAHKTFIEDGAKVYLLMPMRSEIHLECTLVGERIGAYQVCGWASLHVNGLYMSVACSGLSESSVTVFALVISVECL